MKASSNEHWADVLHLREEVVTSDGSVGDLQMSLHKAVYQTVLVDYRKAAYYGEITQPTPNLVGFFSRVARRLGTSDAEPTALFHLDQGMGGGKSHALVGLWHMASHPNEFFGTDLGMQVKAEAEQGGLDINLINTRTIVLTADYFSPGKPSETFGPATTLFERFLWSLTDGDNDRYHAYVSAGPNKETLQRALSDVGRPVLILLDELMDYVQQLSDVSNVDTMPNEKAFLNALMDACDDVPQVAFIIVMIRSELDEKGYSPVAADFRDYVTERLVRNGTTVAVTESQDFSAIIRRRLFKAVDTSAVVRTVTAEYRTAAAAGWGEKVVEKLGPNRGLTGFADRLQASFPFHPDLMRLVREEWSQVQNFQRVRSTVSIFARTALHWSNEHKAGRWAPTLIGVGDVPLTVALESLLSSGLLMGNDRAIQGYRSVATTDITTSEATGGRAVAVDTALRASGVTARQPHAAVRMATALFCYSIVSRPRGLRGATKAEILASILEPTPAPGTPYTDAEEVFNALTGEQGLGALEVTTPPNAPARFHLSIKQTLRMYFNASMALVDTAAKDRVVWDQAQRLTRMGPFEKVIHVEAPPSTGAVSLPTVFDGVDAAQNRLVVLDPRRWTLLNGRDQVSRDEITALLGLGAQALVVDNAASCVVAAVNTQRREVARKRAGELLGWQHVLKQIGEEEVDEREEARRNLADVETKLKRDVEKAYQHYAYVVRADDGLHVEFKRFDEDTKSSLRGDHVWSALVQAGRASAAQGLSEAYLAAILDTFQRDLTPREIVQGFYRNPVFPLVPDTDEIRRAIFALLSHDWELVDSDAQRLSITSAEQISIASLAQSLRRRLPDPPRVPDGGPVNPDTAGDRTEPDPYRRDPAPAPGPAPEGGAVGGGDTVRDTGQGDSQRTYRNYSIELTNRSVTTVEAREQVWELLKELSKVLDSDQADHQLFSLKASLTTASGDQGAIEEKARAVGARVTVEDDDF